MNVIENLKEGGFVGQVQPNSLIHADCLDAMKYIESKSIDMILCDLPYGTTACKWDVVIPFNKHIKEINNRGKEIILYRDEYILQEVKKGKSYKDTINYFDNNAIDGLWDNYNRIIKDNGAIVLFGSEPFSSYLRMSNIKQYKYDWYWNKGQGLNFVTAKIRPLNDTETISIFCKGKCNYYPVMENAKPENIRPINKGTRGSEIQGNIKIAKSAENYDKNKRYPKTSIFINSRIGECNSLNRIHPTQKPVALLEYLIKTYTLEGETVLDNCAGSGSTGIACLNTKRNFIGIEKDTGYFEIANKRIADAIKDSETKLF